MKNVFSEESISELAKKYLDSVKEKFEETVVNDTYDRLSEYLYEHYTNFQDKIEEKLIDSICEEFVKDPMNYKFLKLRNKLFNENKTILTEDLTDEAIFKSVEDVIWEYTNRDYTFDWKWKEAIVQIIFENWDKFKNDEKIKSVFINKIEKLNNQVKHLREKLQRIKDEI